MTTGFDYAFFQSEDATEKAANAIRNQPKIRDRISPSNALETKKAATAKTSAGRITQKRPSYRTSPLRK